MEKKKKDDDARKLGEAFGKQLEKKKDNNPLQQILGGIYKTSVDASTYVQYTGVPQDKGGKSKPGYGSNYQSTPSPSKSSRESYGGYPVTPDAPKKKKKSSGGGGKSSSYAE